MLVVNYHLKLLDLYQLLSLWQVEEISNEGPYNCPILYYYYGTTTSLF